MNKVLIIEDSEDMSYIYKTLFEKNGCFVEIADNWLNWIVKFDSKKNTNEFYNLVLLDLQMPEINWFEVLQQFKNVQNENNTTIIVLSNHWWQEIENKVKTLWADAFFQKNSYPLPELYNRIIQIQKDKTSSYKNNSAESVESFGDFEITWEIIKEEFSIVPDIVVQETEKFEEKSEFMQHSPEIEKQSLPPAKEEQIKDCSLVTTILFDKSLISNALINKENLWEIKFKNKIIFEYSKENETLTLKIKE